MEKANLNYIKDLSGGDLEFEQKMVEILKNEFPDELEIYTESIKEKKYLETAQIVHKLKHKISILGLEKSYEIAVEYERDLNKNKIIRKDDFEKILTNMTNFINQL